MKILVEGQAYEFDQSRLMLSEAMAIKSYTGLKPPQWQAALTEGDPEALQALVWLLKKRNGEDVRFSDVDFNLADVSVEADEDPQPAE